MALNKNLKEELKELQKEKREMMKREKVLRQHLKVEQDIGKWKQIMDVRSACEKIIKDANLGMSMSLEKLSKYPDYFIYQHPVDKKLKTTDRNANWVKEYLGEIPMSGKGGITGVEADLLDTARKSTMSAWVRMTKKKKPVRHADIGKLKFLSGKGSTGKGRTSGTGIG
jgi:hypothetical protein